MKFMKRQILLNLLLSSVFCVFHVSAQEKLQEKTEKQCGMYYQTGFFGKEVSFNFVNTEIRDVLRYFYEQVGCDSVVDESVSELFVTAKAEKLPWNNALESILQSRDLSVIIKEGTFTSTNIKSPILFVATKEKILREMQMGRSRGRLDSVENFGEKNKESIYTEFVQLKNIPSCSGDSKCTDTLTAFNFVKKAIIRRLSRKGNIQFDERNLIFIISDVRSNLETVKHFIEFIDNKDLYNQIEENKQEENPRF